MIQLGETNTSTHATIPARMPRLVIIFARFFLRFSGIGEGFSAGYYPELESNFKILSYLFVFLYCGVLFHKLYNTGRACEEIIIDTDGFEHIIFFFVSCQARLTKVFYYNWMK